MPTPTGPRRPGRRRYRGFPKRLPCLVCDRPRRATWPGDRIHSACRKARQNLSQEPELVSLATISGKELS